MILEQSLSEKFPKCANYLLQKLSLPGIKTQKPKIWSAFQKCCEINIWAEKALTPGQGPIIRIVSKLPNERPDGCVAGVFSPITVFPDTARFVHIDQRLAHQLQDKGSPLDFEKTVLHETVHWARFHGKNQFPSQINGDHINIIKSSQKDIDPSLPLFIEAGNAFMILAYGTTIIESPAFQPCRRLNLEDELQGQVSLREIKTLENALLRFKTGNDHTKKMAAFAVGWVIINLFKKEKGKIAGVGYAKNSKGLEVRKGKKIIDIGDRFVIATNLNSLQLRANEMRAAVDMAINNQSGSVPVDSEPKWRWQTI